MASEQFNGIQALRALAAMAVVFSHLVGFEAKHLPGGVLVPDWFEFGQFGVDLFFVLSGFIIVESSRSLHGSATGAGEFLLRRLIRIFPVYWVYLAPLVLLWWLYPGILGAGQGREVDLIASLFLYPSATSHLMLVSWTLSFELYFYLVFALVMAVLPRARLGQMLLVWAVLTLTVFLTLRPTNQQPFLNLAANPLVLEFLAGGAVALLRPRIPARAGLVLLGVSLLVIIGGIAVMTSFGVAFRGDWVRVAVFGTGSSILLAGVVALERTAGAHYPRWVLALGDASYSLYLGHLMAIAVIGRLWRALLPDPSVANHLAAIGTAVVASAILSLLSYRLVEAPLLIHLRPLTRLRRQEALRPA